MKRVLKRRKEEEEEKRSETKEDGCDMYQASKYWV